MDPFVANRWKKMLCSFWVSDNQIQVANASSTEENVTLMEKKHCLDLTVMKHQAGTLDAWATCCPKKDNGFLQKNQSTLLCVFKLKTCT